MDEFMTTLQTERLTLEPLEPGHAESMFGGLRDPRLYQFIEEQPPLSVGGLRARYEILATRRSPDGSERWLNWAVLRADGGRYLGYVQATVRGDGLADVACVIFVDGWGQGFGREAVAAMLAHLHERWAVSGACATVDPRNVSSVRLLTALGFEQVKTRAGAAMIHGVLTGEAEYRLLLGA